MRNAYRRRPEDFRRRILSRVDTSKRDLLDVEGKWLSLMRTEELKGVRYYNMNLSTKPGHWTAIPGYDKTIGEKISASHRANPEWGAWNKGKVVPEETRSKISSSVSKLMTEEKRAGLSEKCSGWSHSAEAKKKIRARSSKKTHICGGCGKSFTSGPYAIHMRWLLEDHPVDKYAELRGQGLSYRAIARIHDRHHKEVKKRLEHR